jgi:hypothetical protein
VHGSPAAFHRNGRAAGRTRPPEGTAELTFYVADDFRVFGNGSAYGSKGNTVGRKAEAGLPPQL